MNVEQLLEKCGAVPCDSWSCIFTTYSQTLTFIAAFLGIILCAIVLYKFRTAAVEHVGLGLAGMLAIGVLLISLPAVNKISLSFAAQQSVLLEFKQTASADNICTTQNLITTANKPLIDRISKLETLLESSAVKKPTGIDDGPVVSVKTSEADLRIYFRHARKSDAEKLLAALRALFPTVSIDSTNLTEVGDTREVGFNRVRYETSPNTTLAEDAKKVKEEVAKSLGKPVAGPDPIDRPLPGDIQILLY